MKKIGSLRELSAPEHFVVIVVVLKTQSALGITLDVNSMAVILSSPTSNSPAVDRRTDKEKTSARMDINQTRMEKRREDWEKKTLQIWADSNRLGYFRLHLWFIHMFLIATLLNQTKLSTLLQSLGLKIVKLWLLKYFLPLWDREGYELHQILNCWHFSAKLDKTKTLGDITADSQSSSSCCIRTGPAPRPCGQWSPPQLGKCPQQMCCWYISPSSTTPSPPSAQVCVLSRTNIPWEESTQREICRNVHRVCFTKRLEHTHTTEEGAGFLKHATSTWLWWLENFVWLLLLQNNKLNKNMIRLF